jgi:DNA-binding LytR/AlgR family response regulator
MAVCKGCGATVAGDWRFCRRCGSSLTASENVTTRLFEEAAETASKRKAMAESVGYQTARLSEQKKKSRALRTLIIDDEASARSRLRKFLSDHSEIEIVGEASDGLNAVAAIEALRPDLIFLDVQMPGLNGFEVLRALPKTVPLPLVIFATAYDEYALAAFEADAIGYLLKPINRERLRQAVERAQKLILSDAQADDERERIRHVVQTAVPSLQQIVARKRDRYVLLDLDQILFFRVEDGLVKVKTEAELYWTDYQLTDLEARLPDPPFFRAHRSVIVNLRKVKEIAPFFKSSFLLIMSDRDGSQIQVSERQSKKLRELLQA